MFPSGLRMFWSAPQVIDADAKGERKRFRFNGIVLARTNLEKPDSGSYAGAALRIPTPFKVRSVR